MVDESGISLDIFHERREALRRQLRERWLDAAVIGPGANLYYLTGNWGHLTRRFTALLVGLRSSSDELFVCPAFEEQMHREAVRSVSDFRSWQRREPPTGGALAAIQEWGLASGKIALDQALPWGQIEPLLKSAPAIEFSSLAETMSALRMIKSSVELAEMRRATLAANAAIAEALGSLAPGVAEEELERQFIAAAERGETAGAGSWILMLFGPSSAEPHGFPQRRKLAADDVVLYDFGTTRGKYHSDTTRTVLRGRADDEARRVWDIVHRAYLAGRQAARPGQTFTQVDAAARQVIVAAGYGDYFTHGLGHGIGLEIHERPFPEPIGDVVLQAGMTITIEPGIYLGGRFGVRLEDTVVITEDGCEPIVDAPPMQMEATMQMETAAR